MIRFTYIAPLAAVALAGCMEPPAPPAVEASAPMPTQMFQPAPLPIPLEVLTSAPAGTGPNDVLVSNGCYFTADPAGGAPRPVMVTTTAGTVPFCGA